MPPDSWHSYPSIYALGHRYLGALLTVPVIAEEKVDGSQFSFCKAEDGELLIRSKGQQMVLDAPEKMFEAAVQTVKDLAPLLTPGWTYRTEFLAKPKHNTIAYARVPKGHLVLFDVNTGHESYLTWEEKAAEAERLGIDVTPRLFTGKLEDPVMLRGLMDNDSFLGGSKIEGVVVKQQDPVLFGQDKKALIGKFVREGFHELNTKEFRKSNPTQLDLISELILEYKSEARWRKAVQHLRESGRIDDTPKDIGFLMKEIPEDIKKEAEEVIKDRLFAFAWPKIARGVAAGVPDWYKEELMKKQFESAVVGQFGKGTD
ncbi:MAG: RNA ligase family protein [Candidatus Sulfotelmatobacter sp.]